MTKAIREATVDEYLTLVEKGDHDGFIDFVAECFGSDEDFNAEAADAFALEALPKLNEKVKEAMENVTEATPEIMEAVAEQNKVIEAGAKAENTVEAKEAETDATNSTDEVKVEASEAPSEG